MERNLRSRNDTIQSVIGQVMAMPSTLVMVWKMASNTAIWLAKPNKPAMPDTSHSRGDNRVNATIAVITLKKTWALAARFAGAVAPITARAAVEVVPTLAPITMAAAALNGTK